MKMLFIFSMIDLVDVYTDKNNKYEKSVSI